MTPETVTLTISAFRTGRTKDVEFTASGPEGQFVSPYVFAAQIGNGKKVHRTDMVAWEFASYDEARSGGYQMGDIVTTEDGRVFGCQRVINLRNRRARIIGHASEYEGTDAASTHNAYSGF